VQYGKTVRDKVVPGNQLISLHELARPIEQKVQSRSDVNKLKRHTVRRRGLLAELLSGNKYESEKLFYFSRGKSVELLASVRSNSSLNTFNGRCVAMQFDL